MKCLLKYQWVKLPRSQMPAGKGVMGAWARLASRAAFRNGQAHYYKYVNQVTIGSWSGGIVGLKSILGVKKRNKALGLMDELARLGYIDYELDPKTKKLTYQTKVWGASLDGRRNWLRHPGVWLFMSAPEHYPAPRGGALSL